MANNEDNIFSMAGKQSPKPKPKPTSVPPKREQKPRIPGRHPRWVEGKLPPPSDPKEEAELRNRFKQVMDLRDKLEKQLEQVYSKGGLTKDSVTRYLDNPSNYSGSEYEETRKRRKIMQQELWSQVGEDVKEQVEAKEEAKKSKKNKRKGLSARRRNWINMR